MRLQIIQDRQGNDAGVFIAMKDWATIKENYPDIDTVDADIPEWQKKVIDERLKKMGLNEHSVLPIDTLFDELNNAYKFYI